MQVKVIHFIPRHEFHVVFQETEREELASGIEHEATLLILRIIPRGSSYDVRSCWVLKQDLQNGARTVEGASICIGANHRGVPHFKDVPLVANATVRVPQSQEKVA